ncbi:MAG: hypothetical protein ACE5HV_00035 [Acidobacteriota bacterium]
MADAHEKALRAAIDAFFDCPDEPPFSTPRRVEVAIDEYLAARPDLKRVPAGWKVVPIAMTQEMVLAGIKTCPNLVGIQVIQIVDAALAAAPEPEEG